MATLHGKCLSLERELIWLSLGNNEAHNSIHEQITGVNKDEAKSTNQNEGKAETVEDTAKEEDRKNMEGQLSEEQTKNMRELQSTMTYEMDGMKLNKKMKMKKKAKLSQMS